MNLIPFAAGTKKITLEACPEIVRMFMAKLKKMISISHWCRDADHGKPNITGFKTIVRFGSLEIRKQIIPPSHYINTRDVLQPGIADKYEPTVKRRF